MSINYETRITAAAAKKRALSWSIKTFLVKNDFGNHALSVNLYTHIRTHWTNFTFFSCSAHSFRSFTYYYNTHTDVFSFSLSLFFFVFVAHSFLAFSWFHSQFHLAHLPKLRSSHIMGQQNDTHSLRHTCTHVERNTQNMFLWSAYMSNEKTFVIENLVLRALSCTHTLFGRCSIVPFASWFFPICSFSVLFSISNWLNAMWKKPTISPVVAAFFPVVLERPIFVLYERAHTAFCNHLKSFCEFLVFFFSFSSS